MERERLDRLSREELLDLLDQQVEVIGRQREALAEREAAIESLLGASFSGPEQLRVKALDRIAAADQLRFAQALIAPPAPTPALKRAFVRRRTLIADE